MYKTPANNGINYQPPSTGERRISEPSTISATKNLRIWISSILVLHLPFWSTMLLVNSHVVRSCEGEEGYPFQADSLTVLPIVKHQTIATS